MSAGTVRKGNTGASVANLESLRLLTLEDDYVDSLGFEKSGHSDWPGSEGCRGSGSENLEFGGSGYCERPAFEGITPGQKLFSLVASCVVAFLLMLIPGLYLS